MGQAKSWERKASSEQRVVSSPLKAALFRSGNQSFLMMKRHSFRSFIHCQQLQKYVMVHTVWLSRTVQSHRLLGGLTLPAGSFTLLQSKTQQESRQECLRRSMMPFAGPAGSPKVSGILTDAGCGRAAPLFLSARKQQVTPGQGCPPGPGPSSRTGDSQKENPSS